MYKTEIITYKPLAERENILNAFLKEGYEYFNTISFSQKDSYKEIITLKKIQK